jgi:hypothetical protein
MPPSYPLSMGRCYKSHNWEPSISQKQQPFTTAEDAYHTIASLLPPDPKYEQHYKRLIPQSGLRPHPHAHTYIPYQRSLWQ